MNKVRVKKAELLAILNKNKVEHGEIFRQAQEAYRQAAIKELEAQLALARTDGKFTLKRINEMVLPSDYTDQYERAIKMLEMSIDDTIEISASEFANYVEDSWSWSREWGISNSNYLDNPKLAAASRSR